ncbi:hypothetical protein [Lentibacillus kimchii]|uniref:Uncharacterized protein n=1 Tax=Lentibacillus kimchii TaxID=1542911 RepID=A0ABW2USJ9_9BACI
MISFATLIVAILSEKK